MRAYDTYFSLKNIYCNIPLKSYKAIVHKKLFNMHLK